MIAELLDDVVRNQELLKEWVCFGVVIEREIGPCVGADRACDDGLAYADDEDHPVAWSCESEKLGHDCGLGRMTCRCRIAEALEVVNIDVKGIQRVDQAGGTVLEPAQLVLGRPL